MPTDERTERERLAEVLKWLAGKSGDPELILEAEERSDILRAAALLTERTGERERPSEDGIFRRGYHIGYADGRAENPEDADWHLAVEGPAPEPERGEGANLWLTCGHSTHLRAAYSGKCGTTVPVVSRAATPEPAGEGEATAALRHAKRELREAVARLDTVLQRGGLDRATEAARNTVASIAGQLEVLADSIDAALPAAPQDATGEEGDDAV